MRSCNFMYGWRQAPIVKRLRADDLKRHTRRLMRFLENTRYLSQRRSGILLALAIVLLVGCHSKNLLRTPSLEMTRVPLANPGGPEQMDYIEGRANGASPDQQIVLYAHSDGIWWLQPFANRPFTKIQADSTWKNSTHLGSEYAAVLVEPGYTPSPKIETLPKDGNGVVAVLVVEGKAPPKPLVSKVIHFSGYDWIVRSAGSNRGGETNAYDPANAWTDSRGYLHLQMTERDGRWSCADVRLNRSLGYGTYRFVVQDSAHMEPSGVLGIFTWDEARAEETRTEMDIELSRWGNPSSKNAQYVVQPYYVPENISRFMVPAGVLTYMLRWEPGVASFKTIRGSVASGGSDSVSEHVFNSGVPIPASESVHINLYDFHHSKNSSQRPTEVVIQKFEYLP